MITIVDYQMGNLRSVAKAIEKVGGQAVVMGDPKEIERAEKLILPGVGAFRDAIDQLRRADLVEPIRAHVAQDKPFLGICLGLQLLFEKSYEDGAHEGLGILAGDVVRFAGAGPLKVPHMGWNSLEVIRRAPVLEGLAAEPYVYFVHSYYVRPGDESVIAARTEYGARFTSVVWRKNLFATQFHPEKSQKVGLGILRRFVELT